MTEDITALIAELRMPEYSPHAVQHRAADALEAQAQRITELLDDARAVVADREMYADRADALAAQIAEARAAIGIENAWDGHARADQLDNTRRILSKP